jgi:hypothetical protein
MKEDYIERRCDKCGQLVTRTNSAVNLQDIFTGTVGFVHDRHLYPVPDCEGSPTRVKLIEEDEDWANAYKELLEN